jgi:hypothetical protein
LNKAASIAVNWARADGATFENTKTELIHHPPGRSDQLYTLGWNQSSES